MVSIETDSIHMVIKPPLVPTFLIGSSFLQITRTTIKSGMSSNLGRIRQWTVELAALAYLEIFPYTCTCTYYEKDLVLTLAPSILIGSSSFIAGNEDMHKILNEFKFREGSHH